MANRRPHRRNDPNCDCNTCLNEAYGYDWRELVPGHGWLRDFVDHALETTDAPPVYHVASGLAALAAVVGATCVFKAEPDDEPIPLNLWILVAGTSAVQRKSTAVLKTKKVLEKYFPHFMVSYTGSPEAIFSEIVNQPECIMVIPEFLNFLAGTETKYAGTLKTTLMELYDGDPVQGRITRGKGKEIITAPRVSMIGGAALNGLDRHLKDEDFRAGFLSRMMFVAGDKKKWKPKVKAYTPDLEVLQKDLHHIARWSSAQGIINASRDGNSALTTLSKRIDDLTQQADPSYQSLINRNDLMSKKISALFAASMQNPSVYKSMVEERVTRLINHSIEVTEHYLIKMLAEDEQVRAAERLKRYLKTTNYKVGDWIPMRELVRRSKSARYAVVAVEQLEYEEILSPITKQPMPGEKRAKKRVQLLSRDF